MTLSTTPRRLALIAVPVFAVTVCVFVLLDLQVIFEPPWLLPILNTVFLSAALFAVAYLAGRGCRARCAAHVLIFGNAVLVYGAGSLIAGRAIGAHGSVKSAVSLHNAAAAIAGTLHLASGLLAKSERRAGPERREEDFSKGTA